MRRFIQLITCSLVLSAQAPSAHAERIANPIGVFSTLDKITALTKSFEAKLNEEVPVGSLTVKMFSCYTRPITERPETAAFIQVYTDATGGKREAIFSGWIFAESPSLNALEHPVYDIWLTGCRDPAAPPPAVEAPPVEVPAEQEPEPED